MKYLSLMAAASVLLLGCSSLSTVKQLEPQASAAAIEGHMLFLASDELEGRDTGSRGHEIASLYIATQLQALGLEPAGDNGTFYQRVPLRSSRLVPNSARMVLHTADGDQELAYPKAFFSGADPVATESSITAPLVFVGYGLISDEFGINDYQGLDLNGKIAIMLPGLPEHIPSEEAAHLGRERSRFAAEQGAVGIITIHTPQREAMRPYANSILYLNTPSMRWLDSDGQPGGVQRQLRGGAYVHHEAAEALFAEATTPLSTIFAMLDAKEMPQGFELNISATLSRQSTHDDISSPNVVAVLPGSDPSLRHEYVVLTAHSDHIGVIQDVRSDNRVNNGAMDNAAGVAILLETARMFTELAEPPKRSILFLVVTGEEKGLLGADYYAHNPTRPIESLIANVNMDMPVLLYPFADLIAFGANHSSLGPVVERAAAREGIRLSPDPMPEQAIFTRSDHYTLVRQGIPAVFLMTGFQSQDPEQDAAAIWGSFFSKHYHKPTDSIADLTREYGAIRYDFGAIFTQINFNIAVDLANEPQRPFWLQQSYFHDVVGQPHTQQAVLEAAN
ncbi:M28 family metallopeptidase [Alkalimonas amylolytica]|uniref:Zn-dependent amino-or carboxypeptidase, M28 family n=1 Tax=Alkalimonas amylolytica TaxID=152573 RepID=A0A1H4ERI2_ALKAM|nr:M28 family metallopeptidase [Alkalimonas amylolytica]SEA87120.1 Zn-dependent amino-or carboxypeptidase, M28 family [Alkalimonas amylolytica]